MAGLSKNSGRRFDVRALAILALSLAWPVTAHADTLTINIDQAQIMTLPDRVATIVIGNPLIADATLQNGGVLVVTGKGFGETNLLALDRGGHVLLDKTIQVSGPGTKDLVVVYKGVERESYSCAPTCQRRITLGDSPAFFNATLSQSGARNGQAQAAPPH
ncbi:MAG TPA: pilus assembly protein N-terminal domain-containing protein [Pseudolabrys sp.]|nr:pilus assembly protein N-terminal domain-containing protein [Pseudolabrys sp.]